MTVLQALIRRERIAVVLGLLTVIGLAWAWVWSHSAMSMPAGMRMPPAQFPFLFAMWWIMMAAMMLPSAAPMILLFGTVSEHARAQGKPYVPTAVFASAYLLVWGAFSLAAAGLQWWIEVRFEPVMSMGLSSAMLTGTLLVAAGVYQFTPLKDACLRQCRSPLQFLMSNWRPGPRGALRMGLGHGVYCVGCCWALMGLLFVGGVMNLWWVIGVALYVLLEKLVPAGPWLSRGAGLALAAAGAVLLLSTLNP